MSSHGGKGFIMPDLGLLLGMRKARFQVIINIIFSFVLLTFFYNQKFMVNSPVLGRKLSPFVQTRNLGNGFYKGIHKVGLNHGRIMEETHESSLNVTKDDVWSVENDKATLMDDTLICVELYDHKGYLSPCDYLMAHPECSSGGFFNYITFFYCDCKNYSILGYLVLGAWLAILFYLLGNTAADYFCCSIEKLSDLLKLSPTVAGVTLLPLGNGAPDVFASIAAFMGLDSGQVGLNSVLGAAVFVTCIVVGVISICIANKQVQIDRKCFIRDLCFFLFVILCLALILVIGKVNIWGAMAFVLIYVVYAFFVAINEIFWKKGQTFSSDGLMPLLPVAGSESIYASLLSVDNHDNPSDSSPKLPHWIWSSNVAIYFSNVKANTEDNSRPLWGWTDEGAINQESSFSFSKLCSYLELPLTIPRRLTIPIVEEDRWSKIYAVGSAFFAPTLLAFLWNTQENMGPLSGKIAYFIGVIAGSIFAILALIYTSPEHPPRRFLLPWVFGGFFMSIIWFYIVADELVSLLVAMGVILGINPSVLALTVLAWGNSMGDLTSNTALAMNDSKGAQIAMSGCYAGPMFNTLVGLGVSLLLGAWTMGSEPYVVPRDSSLFITIGFLTASLIWSLVVLPLSNMLPNKILGFGLITIYVTFLSIRIITAIGLGSSYGTGIMAM